MTSQDVGLVLSCRLAAVVTLCAMAGVQGAPLLSGPAPDAPSSDAPAFVIEAPRCATAATEAMATALQPSAASFEQCHASIDGLASSSGELQAGAATAREALAESRAMVASLNTLLATINTPGGVGPILGKIPKFGIFIKTGLKVAAETVAKAELLAGVFNKAARKMDLAADLTAQTFGEASRVTGPVATLLIQGHAALSAVHACTAGDTEGADTCALEATNRVALDQEDAAVQLAALDRAGATCAESLEPTVAAVASLVAAAGELPALLTLLAEAVGAVDVFIREVDALIANFNAALSSSTSAQCALAVFKPVTDVVNVLTCPVDDAIDAAFRMVVDAMVLHVATLLTAAGNRLATDGAAAAVPDGFELTVPGFVARLPAQAWVGACGAAADQFPGHARTAAAVADLVLPARFVASAIEREVLDEYNAVLAAEAEAAEAAGGANAARGASYESACVSAFNDLVGDYTACAELSYTRGNGRPLQLGGCRSGYATLSKTCSRCYWKKKSWWRYKYTCDSYTRSTSCGPGYVQDSLALSPMCYQQCKAGYHGVGPVCWKNLI